MENYDVTFNQPVVIDNVSHRQLRFLRSTCTLSLVAGIRNYQSWFRRGSNTEKSL